jgi:hypothetical protein
MMGAAMLFAKILPHHETDLERMLKLGASVRVLTALLAVLTAPLVEEVVYRGVLYPGVAKRWGLVAGVGVTTLLFGLVHVPQYWGSWAAIATIVLLSFCVDDAARGDGQHFAERRDASGLQRCSIGVIAVSVWMIRSRSRPPRRRGQSGRSGWGCS